MELEVTDFDLPMAIDNALMLVRERAVRRSTALHTTVDDRLAQPGVSVRNFRRLRGGRTEGIPVRSASDNTSAATTSDQRSVTRALSLTGGISVARSVGWPFRSRRKNQKGVVRSQATAPR
jgi:hypothetical protein